MYCNNCGEEIKDGADFCPNCGINISSNGVHGNNSANAPKITEKNDKAKKGNKKTRIAIAAILVALIVLNIVQFLYRRYKFGIIYNSRYCQTRDEIEKTDINIKNLSTDEIDIGDYITFGRYEQDNDSSNGTEGIEWRVLDKATADSNGRNCILVISRYALDCRPYNEQEVYDIYGHKYNEDYEDVTWETCDIREWLNNEFYNEAFSEAERNQIFNINNNNPDASFYMGTWGGKGGNATSDKIFLLSYEQAEGLFENSTDRECYPTDYAMWNSVFVGKGHYCNWWLRSPGPNNRYALIVKVDGELDYKGIDLGSKHSSGENCGVRPALWIYVD